MGIHGPDGAGETYALTLANNGFGLTPAYDCDALGSKQSIQVRLHCHDGRIVARVGLSGKT